MFKQKKPAGAPIERPDYSREMQRMNTEINSA